jgi:hypothetical protein
MTPLCGRSMQAPQFSNQRVLEILRFREWWISGTPSVTSTLDGGILRSSARNQA